MLVDGFMCKHENMLAVNAIELELKEHNRAKNGGAHNGSR